MFCLKTSRLGGSTVSSWELTLFRRFRIQHNRLFSVFQWNKPVVEEDKNIGKKNDKESELKRIIPITFESINPTNPDFIKSDVTFQHIDNVIKKNNLSLHIPYVRPFTAVFPPIDKYMWSKKDWIFYALMWAPKNQLSTDQLFDYLPRELFKKKKDLVDLLTEMTCSRLLGMETIQGNRNIGPNVDIKSIIETCFIKLPEEFLIAEYNKELEELATIVITDKFFSIEKERASIEKIATEKNQSFVLSFVETYMNEEIEKAKKMMINAKEKTDGAIDKGNISDYNAEWESLIHIEESIRDKRSEL